jgi:hypothetical protein
LKRTEDAIGICLPSKQTQRRSQPQAEAAPATEVALVPGTNLAGTNFMQEADIVPVTITIPF